MGNSGNVFRVLGLYGKEVVVSNMLAWLLNPNEDHNFGIDIANDFLEAIGCDKINENNSVSVYREYYGKSNNKNNFIDIVIVEKNKDGDIVHVVCIENKVFSIEGDKQTERYWNIIQDNFSKYNCKIECRYLTKNNFNINLSNSNFIHYKYLDLEVVLKKYSSNKVVKDFYEAYILSEKMKLDQLKELSFELYLEHFQGDKMEKDLCFYVTENFMSNTKDICCDISNSAKGGEIFYKLWKQNWNKTIDNINFNIHIEAYGEKVYVHFETLPYIPYRKLDEETKEIMDREKERLIQKIDILEEIEGIEKKKIRGNATLTVGNFKLRYNGFHDYYLIVHNLINKLDLIIDN